MWIIREPCTPGWTLCWDSKKAPMRCQRLGVRAAIRIAKHMFSRHAAIFGATNTGSLCSTPPRLRGLCCAGPANIIHTAAEAAPGGSAWRSRERANALNNLQVSPHASKRRGHGAPANSTASSRGTWAYQMLLPLRERRRSSWRCEQAKLQSVLPCRHLPRHSPPLPAVRVDEHADLFATPFASVRQLRQRLLHLCCHRWKSVTELRPSMRGKARRPSNRSLAAACVSAGRPEDLHKPAKYFSPATTTTSCRVLSI